MKKKFVSMLMVASMAAMMLAGCGSDTTTDTTSDDTATADATVEEAVDTAAEEGKTLNIYVWNTEFISRLTDHYPGYEKVDDTHGKIGDVDVVFTITESTDNAYQNNLDEKLLAQADAADDDKIDIFLVEADYALKYVDTDYAMKVSDLGITDADVADQYQYTKDIVTDSEGNLKGLSWQACSAGLIYNRDAATAILGSDDPETVQAAVADWDSYIATAEKAKAAGYKMCSVNDTYRVYSNNVSAPWVSNDTITIDSNIQAWVEDSKTLVDASEETTDDLWGDDWAKGKYPEGNIFCYFGPAWFFNFSLAADDSASIAANGGWGFVVGPQSFYWGGTWICAATGTDNPTLVKDIMLTMTTDQTVLKEIATADSDCVNSKTVLADLASSDDGNLACLGGQNPYAVLAEGAENIDMSNISAYDQGCNEEFQNAMKNYYNGNATYDEALDAFYTAVIEKYPNLSK